MEKTNSDFQNRIYFQNNQRKEKITKELKALLEHVIECTLLFEGIKINSELSVIFVSEKKIRKINKEHRGIDRVTDVLSFPLLDGEYSEADLDGGFLCLGDIVICPERARKQAEEYGHSFIREMAFLCAHSMLHLLGYDHEASEKEETDMFARQKIILENAGIPRQEYGKDADKPSAK